MCAAVTFTIGYHLAKATVRKSYDAGFQWTLAVYKAFNIVIESRTHAIICNHTSLYLGILM